MATTVAGFTKPVLILVALAALSCAGNTKTTSQQTKPNSPLYLPSDGFAYTKLTVEKAAVPARFAASPAQSVAELDDPTNYPPPEQFSRWLCTGEYDARDKWLETLAKVTEDGGVPEKLRWHYERLGSAFCEGREWCERLDEALGDDASESMRKILQQARDDCGGDGPDLGFVGGDTDAQRGDFKKKLRQWGLIPEGSTAAYPEVARRAVTVPDYLRAYGHLDVLDLETGTFPNHHDVTLDRLAALTGGVLDDVLFEEIPPEYDEEAGEAAGDYVLHAYMGGNRYAVTAKNHGDWLDFDTCLRFINTLLHQRQSDVRCVNVGVEKPQVACGPGRALLEAHEAGLLVFDLECRGPECGRPSSVREQVMEKEWRKGLE